MISAKIRNLAARIEAALKPEMGPSDLEQTRWALEGLRAEAERVEGLENAVLRPEGA